MFESLLMDFIQNFSNIWQRTRRNGDGLASALDKSVTSDFPKNLLNLHYFGKFLSGA